MFLLKKYVEFKVKTRNTYNHVFSLYKCELFYIFMSTEIAIEVTDDRSKSMATGKKSHI